MFPWILSFTSHTENKNFKTFYWGYGKQILTGARNLATMSRLCSTPKKRCKDGKQQPFQILAITAFSNFWQNNGSLKFWQTTAFSHLGKLPFQILATNSPGKLPFRILATDSHLHPGKLPFQSWLTMAFSTSGKQLPWQTTALISFFCLVGT